MTDWCSKHGPYWRLADNACQACNEDKQDQEWLETITPAKIEDVYFTCCDHAARRGQWVCRGCFEIAVNRAFAAGRVQGCASAARGDSGARR